MTAAVDEPRPDCRLCPRLASLRDGLVAAEPNWFNGPVPSFGERQPRLLVVGLAPGLRGANRTGRPFTGDYAGDLLYAALDAMGFSRGTYAADPADGLELIDCQITNAVRCLPPQNKPTPAEIRTCQPFLAAKLRPGTRLNAVVALGRVAHTSTIAALGARQSSYPFKHGAVHAIDHIRLFDSFHCSRYNTNTGRLTEGMFFDVFRNVRGYLDEIESMT